MGRAEGGPPEEGEGGAQAWLDGRPTWRLDFSEDALRMRRRLTLCEPGETHACVPADPLF